MYSTARISCSETDLALGSASRDERFQYVSLRFNHPLRAYFVSPEQDPIGNARAWNARVKATLYYDLSDIRYSNPYFICLQHLVRLDPTALPIARRLHH